MDAKLDKISELSNILCEKESLGKKIVGVGHEFSLHWLVTREILGLDDLPDGIQTYIYMILLRENAC